MSFSFRQEIKSPPSIYLLVALCLPIPVVRNIHLRYVPSDFLSLSYLTSWRGDGGTEGWIPLLPKLGLKIGEGQNTTPAVSRKGSYLTLINSPLHHTQRRGRNHVMSRMKIFTARKPLYTYQVSKKDTLSYINRKLAPILWQQLPTDPWNSHGNTDGCCFR